MPRSIDNVDTVIPVLHSSNFGRNGNTALFFLITAVHDELLRHFSLVITKRLRLLEQAIYDGRFTMINVSNHGNVSNVFWFLSGLHTTTL